MSLSEQKFLNITTFYPAILMVPWQQAQVGGWESTLTVFPTSAWRPMELPTPQQ